MIDGLAMRKAHLVLILNASGDHSQIQLGDHADDARGDGGVIIGDRGRITANPSPRRPR